MSEETEGTFLPVVGSGIRSSSTRYSHGVPPEVVDEFLHLIKTGYGKYKAADLLGFTWDDIAEAIERDDDIERAFEHAKEVRLDEVEEALYGTAIAGNTTAQKFLLTNRRAGRWGDGPVLVERVRASHAPEESEQSQLESQQARERFKNELLERITNAREMAERRREAEEAGGEEVVE